MKNIRNDVRLIGHVGKDPEVRVLDGDKKVASFSLAVKNNYKNREGEYQSQWFNCEAWGKTCELIEKYVKKGQELTVSGSLKVDKWEKEDVKHERIKISVDDFQMHGKKSESNDDLPF